MTNVFHLNVKQMLIFFMLLLIGIHHLYNCTTTNFLSCLSFEAYYLSVNQENVCIYIATYVCCA